MRYKLSVRIGIRSVDPAGYDQGHGLEVNEDAELNANSFMEVAAIILAHFHELTETLKRGEPKKS